MSCACPVSGRLNRFVVCAHLLTIEPLRQAPVIRNSEKIFDEYLVTAAATGDQPALARLVVRWQPRLLRHAWRVTGDAEQAKDATQESWIEILRGLGRLNDVAAFPAWAYRIVTRRCQRSFGRTKREALHSELVDDDFAMMMPEHLSGEFTAELSLVAAELALLPPEQRAAVALFYLEGLSVAEMAIALDVPPGTVKTRLMHARRKVRERLTGESDGQV